MDPQYAQDGSFMPNVNMQMQQRMRNMNPQEQLAYIQQYRQHHAQTQEACAGNGQQLVGGPNHTQGINMGMATDQGPTVCSTHCSIPHKITRGKVHYFVKW